MIENLKKKNWRNDEKKVLMNLKRVIVDEKNNTKKKKKKGIVTIVWQEIDEKASRKVTRSGESDKEKKKHYENVLKTFKII